MPYVFDRVAARSGRDRDLLPDGPRLGPYEAPYDVRRGYQEPLRRAPRGEEPDATLLFRRADPRETEQGEA